MEEASDQINQKFLEGFNHGYFLQKYEPELAEKLLKIEASNPHLLGLQHGCEQFKKEQLRDKLPKWLKDNPSSDKSNLTQKDHDKQLDKE